MTDYLVPELEQPTAGGSTPSFSVLIPAYQAAATIADAVSSALGQTAPPLEIIICDDGSTDELASALAPYRDDVLLVSKPNGGGASALNAALAAASGSFVVVLDADDAYEPERLAAMAQLASLRPDLDLLSTDAYFEFDGRKTGRFNRANPFPVVEQREAILRSCYLFAPAVRRARLNAVGGFDESLRIAYDWDCWIRLILSGCAAGLVDRPLTNYRLHEGSLAANRLAALEERVTVLQKVERSAVALTNAEQTALKRSLSTHRARLLRAQAEAALLNGDASRRHSLEVALTGGSSASARLKALAAALAPRLAARRLAKATQEETVLARPTGGG